jgi:hypothetical protein
LPRHGLPNIGRRLGGIRELGGEVFEKKRCTNKIQTPRPRTMDGLGGKKANIFQRPMDALGDLKTPS